MNTIIIILLQVIAIISALVLIGCLLCMIKWLWRALKGKSHKESVEPYSSIGKHNGNY